MPGGGAWTTAPGRSTTGATREGRRADQLRVRSGGVGAGPGGAGRGRWRRHRPLSSGGARGGRAFFTFAAHTNTSRARACERVGAGTWIRSRQTTCAQGCAQGSGARGFGRIPSPPGEKKECERARAAASASSSRDPLLDPLLPSPRAPPATPCSPRPIQRIARSSALMMRARCGHWVALATATTRRLRAQRQARGPPLPRLVAQPQAPPALIALQVPQPLASPLMAASWGSRRSTCSGPTGPCTSRRCLGRLLKVPSRGPTTAPTARSSRPGAQGA